MVQAPDAPLNEANILSSPSLSVLSSSGDLQFQLPDPEDDTIPEMDFQTQVNQAWQVCDRFDLQTDIWRGRILKAVRDREKAQTLLPDTVELVVGDVLDSASLAAATADCQGLLSATGAAPSLDPTVP